MENQRVQLQRCTHPNGAPRPSITISTSMSVHILSIRPVCQNAFTSVRHFVHPSFCVIFPLLYFIIFPMLAAIVDICAFLVKNDVTWDCYVCIGIPNTERVLPLYLHIYIP